MLNELVSDEFNPNILKVLLHCNMWCAVFCAYRDKVGVDMCVVKKKEKEDLYIKYECTCSSKHIYWVPTMCYELV